MKRKTPRQFPQLVSLFPKLYYFIPCIRERDRTVGSTVIAFDEPMDAMLWFIELLEREDGTCLKATLRKLVCRWYGSEAERTFQRHYTELLEKAFIQDSDSEADARYSVVSLTDSGKLLLQEIKAQRSDDLSPFQLELSKLSPRDARVVMKWLERLATVSWSKMRNDAGASRSPT